MIWKMKKNTHDIRPEKVLKRGYSINLLNGKPVKNAETVNPGDILHPSLFQGTIKSVIANE
jgi:exonuclease VII large subunit